MRADEARPGTRPEYNQRAKAARFALPGTRDPLLDHTPSKVGCDQSSFGLSNRFAQHRIADASLPREARERLVPEYSHWPGIGMSWIQS
jgi:hypothetical protein